MVMHLKPVCTNKSRSGSPSTDAHDCAKNVYCIFEYHILMWICFPTATSLLIMVQSNDSACLAAYPAPQHFLHTLNYGILEHL